MKITLLVIGKTDASYVKAGIVEYFNRIKRYLPFEIKVIPDIKKAKNLSEEIQKKKEGALILNQIGNYGEMVLLDEKGKSKSSREFSGFLQKKMASGLKELVFVIGGPYGFSPEVYNSAQEKISISKMTFSHQLVRIIFLEQLYRALTIIKGEPYHHD